MADDFDTRLDRLDGQSTVLVALEMSSWDAETLAEHYRAVRNKIAGRGANVAAVTSQILEPIDQPWLDDDTVWLGFREGRQAFISAMAEDLSYALGAATADGTPLSEVSALEDIDRLGDFDLVIVVGSGFPGFPEYVLHADPAPVVALCTEISADVVLEHYRKGELAGALVIEVPVASEPAKSR